MAAPPVKSQPLHNFSLPQLKWAHKNSSAAGSSSHHHRFRRRDCPDQHPGKAATDLKPRPADEREAEEEQEQEEENGEVKPWNLRPRKEVIKAATTATTSKRETGADCNGNKGNCNSNGLRSQRLKEMLEGGQAVERKGKRRVWISLSKEEIEEDIYALTGGKPARRPRKWPKNVQKQLECVFPGSYLVGVEADSYRVMMLCEISVEIWDRLILKDVWSCDVNLIMPMKITTFGEAELYIVVRALLDI